MDKAKRPSSAESLGRDGINIRDLAVAHMKAALTPGRHPQFAGDHAAWFDQEVPMALAIARRTPGMWSQFTTDEVRRADLLMEHCLYVANIFCNTNSTDSSLRAMVNVDMHGSNAGSLPNQSASYHAYAIGAYVYFGGASGMNPLLAAYDFAETYRVMVKVFAGVSTVPMWIVGLVLLIMRRSRRASAA